MKLSVSLPEDDVAYLDAYAETRKMSSRSAVVHKAVGLLRASELSSSYQAAWDEWSASEDASLWETTVGDGLR